MTSCQYGLRDDSVGVTLCFAAGEGAGPQAPGEYGLIASRHARESGIYRVNLRTGTMSACYVQIRQELVVCTEQAGPPPAGTASGAGAAATGPAPGRAGPSATPPQGGQSGGQAGPEPRTAAARDSRGIPLTGATQARTVSRPAFAATGRHARGLPVLAANRDRSAHDAPAADPGDDPVSAPDLRRAAAERALALVEPGMRLGIGTGSTAAAFIALWATGCARAST